MDEIKQYKKSFSHMGLSLFVMVLVVMVVQSLLAVIAAFIAPIILTQIWFSLLLVFISMHIVAFSVFFLMMRPAKPGPVREKKKMSIRDFIVVFLICMAATYLFNMVSLGINYLIGLIKQSPVVNPLESVVGGNLVLQILILSVSAPIVEEIIFRKLLLDRLRPFGDRTAIWVSALAFALFHGNLSQALYAMALGMIFAYVVIRTNDIRYSIALHIIINLLGSTVMPLLAGSALQPLIIVAALLVWGFLISGIILFVKNIKRIVLTPGEITLDRSVRFKTIYLNAGMILYFISCVLMFASALLA